MQTIHFIYVYMASDLNFFFFFEVLFAFVLFAVLVVLVLLLVLASNCIFLKIIITFLFLLEDGDVLVCLFVCHQRMLLFINVKSS